MKRRIVSIFVLGGMMFAAAPGVPQKERKPLAETGFESVALMNPAPGIFAEKTSTYRISSTDPQFDLPETCFQKVIGKQTIGGKTEITIRCGMIKTASCLSAASLSQFLADTRFLNLSSPEVKKAASALRGSKDIVADVERFVHGYITNKLIGIPLLSAKQVLAEKSGDCTEHAVLAVSLLRSLGVPSRAVVGMALMASYKAKSNVFVFHMWAEAFVDKHWVSVDAAMPGEKKPNRYVAFSYHSLKTEAPLSYIAALSAIQNLAIRYEPR